MSVKIYAKVRFFLHISKYFTNFAAFFEKIMFKKELTYYFSTPIAYIVIGLYLLCISLMLWVVPGEWNIIDSGYSQVDGLFRISPWLMLLMCPAVTMRLYAEELQSGTWNVLRAQPVPLWRIVLGKFFAAWCLLVLALLPCVVHYVAVYLMAEPMGNVDSGAFWGAFIGLMFLSAAFVSVGTLASAYTRNQIVAYIVGAACCFVLYYGFDLLSMMVSNANWGNAIAKIGFNSHFTSISRGVVDLQDITYFVSVSALFQVLTLCSLSRRI